MSDPVEAVKHGADASAAAVALGSFFELLPPVAALLSVIWLSIQIFSWVEKRIKNRK